MQKCTLGSGTEYTDRKTGAIMGGRGGALFGNILQHHIHVIVEAAQRPHELLVTAHDDVHL